MSELTAVITTIQGPTASVRTLVQRLAGSPLLIIGDEKGPTRYELDGAELFTVEDQARMPFLLAPLLPMNHYSRKNLGYLEAIARGAKCIYETDDDNAPNEMWHPRQLTALAREAEPNPWVNVYRAFTDETIWPRGFSLAHILDERTFARTEGYMGWVDAPIQQALADGAPDVDAVWRLTMDQPFAFERGSSVVLQAGSWCPFNSQSTWWWPEAYPLMYLPSGCPIRMTDIWRSFVAQRCLWEMGHGVVFHATEVFQDRNPHDLMVDFGQETPGYLQNETIVQTLADLTLTGDVASNMLRCYDALVADEVFPKSELLLVNAWLEAFGW